MIDLSEGTVFKIKLSSSTVRYYVNKWDVYRTDTKESVAGPFVKKTDALALSIKLNGIVRKDGLAAALLAASQ